MTTIVIGIDCGLTGAIAKLEYVIDRVTPKYEVIDIPTQMKGDGSGKVKEEVNAAGVAMVLREMTYGQRDEVMVVIERLTGRPMVIAGVKIPTPPSSLFSTGDSYGVLRAVPATMGLRIEYITAKDWKGYFGLKGGKENKHLARAKAIGYYPEAPLTRVKDHNRAEALLLARYGWEVLR